MTTERALLTVEDLLRLPDDHRHYELLDGELVEMSPTGRTHGRIMVKVATPLSTHVEAHDLGEVLAGDPGIILRRHPDRVRAPDICFIARERIPAGGLPSGYLEVVPDLVVEIVSPNDRAADVQAKIEEWLQAGVRLVWAVYPDTRSVVAYQGLDSVRVYKETDALDGGPVLPGFTLAIARIFSQHGTSW